MTTNFEKTGATSGRLTFSIDQETVKDGLDKTFKKVQKTLNVPGFRKGRVPRKMFNQMYGEAALYEDTLNDLLPDAYSKAVEEAGIEPVAQPNIDIESVEKGQDWKLIAEVTLKPEVELGEYKGLEVTKQDREVTEEAVEKNLESRRENLAELTVKEDAAEEGDTVVIDFEGFNDGVAFEGGKGENHSLELGSNSFIPGFEEQLVGIKAGEEKEVTVTFPEEYQAEDLAGKEAVFNVKVHEVKSKELPELDDEFAKDADEDVETLDELKAKIRENLEEGRENSANDARDDEAIRKAVLNAKIEEIPHEMAHDEVHRQMDMFLNNLQQQGISAEMYYQMTNSSESDLHKQFEGEAEFNVRTNLVLEAIVEAENLEANEEDIEKEIKDLAAQYNMPEEQVRSVLSVDMLTKDISLKKAIDLITSTAKETLEPTDSKDTAE
ncbi:trigger factor [Marinilactibacillus psychrotolerans]|uniref:Trigger factor n=2 Tax=Marinilactibacillus psychrotolerans TaxID=191770 RepID=A0A511H3C5_9LACT|nr:trigger factor [Marinilactibacillus psychrotolerans]TLQ08282.1 trigger factor [Marinilactibacillus psychrotolerans]SDC63279.1 trigger factor [Marinilactibacillus psychrotolerans]SJN20632.1 Cell division trigger factor [Marinilactibacillus psychrotolerans 42ea]GEL67289.1 trigger factor [Marinilactibacillus psychrotolerans]GEQ32683.1 trigger factor [Marinilactibacillus psychrotolerans]